MLVKNGITTNKKRQQMKNNCSTCEHFAGKSNICLDFMQMMGYLDSHIIKKQEVYFKIDRKQFNRYIIGFHCTILHSL